jgi:subtilisin family serine protease
MRRIVPVLSLSFVAALAACGESPDPVAPDGGIEAAGERAAARYLVVFQDDVRDVRGTAAEIARGNAFGLEAVREHAARGFTAVIPAHRLDAVRSDPRVKFVERDGPVSLIQPVILKGKPGGGGSAAQVTPWGITRVGGSGDGSGKTAWILDTGIDLDHPDLNTSRNCHTRFVGTSPDDENGHGSHVAGTIAAKNNTVGVVGVAANAWVCSVRVLDRRGSGSWSGVVAGVDYVAANGASGDVANMSLGGTGSNATLEQAVQNAASKGIRFVLAAGNSGANAANFTPARTNGNNIYTISAIDSQDRFASFSNYGNPPIDYAAPGVSVLSTYKSGGTATLSGTSMAAPHVAGILLLGTVKADGFAANDPDGNPDPIAHR